MEWDLVDVVRSMYPCWYVVSEVLGAGYCWSEAAFICTAGLRVMFFLRAGVSLLDRFG